MEILTAIILGIVQGLTEFIPVSSSGHLILFRDFLGLQVDYGLSFDAVLQLATTLAILVYFRKDIILLIASLFRLVTFQEQDRADKILALAVLFGTIPGVFFGFLLEDLMSTIFRDSLLVAGSLVVGGLVMIFAEWMAKRSDKDLTPVSGLKIGFFQALALIPGMSRSGMTIAGGLIVGLKREAAVRFSFVLAFPILLGAGLKKLLELVADGTFSLVGYELLWGSIASFVVGLAAIHFLVKFLQSHSLKVFAIYRFVLALVIVILLV